MENNQIILNITKEKSIKLSADTPDMQTLIDEIILNKDIIDIETISVSTPEGSNFDKEGFEVMIKAIINEYLETLKLEQINYKSKQL